MAERGAIRLSIVLGVSILVGTIVACRGPAGPPGPQGPLGPRGERGDSPREELLNTLIHQAITSRLSELTGPQGPAGASAPDISRYLSSLRSTAVLVEASISKGSGVRISANEILTTRELIGTTTSFNISVRGEGLVLATVAGYDSQRNLALLTFSNTSSAPTAPLPQRATISDSKGTRSVEAIGLDIAVVGFVSEVSVTTPVITFGRIGGLWTSVPDDIVTGQVDVRVEPGMAGGPVFNAYGDLIGILLSDKSTRFSTNIRYLSYSEINEVIGDLRRGVKR